MDTFMIFRDAPKPVFGLGTDTLVEYITFLAHKTCPEPLHKCQLYLHLYDNFIKLVFALQ